MNGDTITRTIDAYMKDGKLSTTRFYGFYIHLDGKTILELLGAVQASNAPIKAEVAAQIGEGYYELTFSELRNALEPFRKEKP